MRLWADSHYGWLERNWKTFCERVGVRYVDMASAHGDKCTQYSHEWESAGIPFNHGVAVYLLTHMYPFEDEVRQTPNGWVSPCGWVIGNYERFRPHLAGLE